MNLNILKYLKDPKLLVILVIIVIGSLGYLYMNREYTRVITEYESKITVLDSTHVVKQAQWLKDSLSMTDSITVTLHKLDSMFIKEKEHTSIKQIVYRVIYKDSIIEIITTDTEILKERDQTIVTLTDSVANSKKMIVSLNTKITSLIDSLGKKKTETVVKWKTDTLRTGPGDKKFMIAGSAFGEATNKIKLNYGLNVSADYKIMNPIFIGATLQKDGVVNWKDDYHLIARVGAKYDF